MADGGDAVTETGQQSPITALLEGTPMYMRTDARRGRGLFARHAIAEGAVVHEEVALCCSRYLEDVLQPTIPVCAHCLRSLEGPRQVVARVTGSRRLAAQLPFANIIAHGAPVPCRYAVTWQKRRTGGDEADDENVKPLAELETGCGAVFCSVRCRTVAWNTYHAVSCPRHSSARQQAWQAFLQYNWEQNGVDYSDTAYLAFHAVAQVVCSYRTHHITLCEAFAPFAHLVQAPLTSFFFSYLLQTNAQDDQKTSDEAESTRVQYEEFLRIQRDPMQSAAVKEQYHPDPTSSCRDKAQFLRESSALMADALDLSPPERDFFTTGRWSNLLGSVLLNGQERSPPSSYEALRDAVESVPHGASTLRAFEQRLLSEASHAVSLEALSQSARGQGIYRVGCLFNHSCEPNVQVVFSGTSDETLTIIAARPIAADEELCISYINEEAPFVVRQQQLFEHYLFECHCPRCLREKALIVKIS